MSQRFLFLRLGLASRLVASGALYAAAVAAQLLSGSVLAGLPFIALAWFLLALRSATNRPKDQGLEEWRAVGDGEVSRVADTLARSSRLASSTLGLSALKTLAFCALLALGLLAGPVFPRASLVLIDLALFCLPGLLFGGIRAHVPQDLKMKLPRFIAMMGVPRPDGYVLTPYLRFDKDEQGRDVPEDLRLMLEPRRKPADLVGVQLQASINKGPNGPVPYLYAVALTKGRSGEAYRFFSGLRPRGYEVERGGDGEYGTVVLRQRTEEGGYHTTDDDCVELMGVALKSLERLSAADRA